MEQAASKVKAVGFVLVSGAGQVAGAEGFEVQSLSGTSDAQLLPFFLFFFLLPPVPPPPFEFDCPSPVVEVCLFWRDSAPASSCSLLPPLDSLAGVDAAAASLSPVMPEPDWLVVRRISDVRRCRILPELLLLREMDREGDDVDAREDDDEGARCREGTDAGVCCGWTFGCETLDSLASTAA